MIRSELAAGVSVLLALLLTACASGTKHMRLYDGVERPNEEIAKLLIPESLEVDSINGEEIPRTPLVLRSGARSFDLLPGSYDVVIFYDAVWPINSSDDEIVRSEPRLTGLDLEAGHTYRLEHREPIHLDDALLLASDLQVTLVDLSSGEVAHPVTELRPTAVRAPVAVNPVPAARRETATASASDADEIPASSRTSVSAPAAASGGKNGGNDVEPASVTAANVSEGLSALELLKFWWQQASPGQRAEFRSWAEE